MRLVFIYGLPATGKLTVAQELAKQTGYRLFHNHLAVDLLLSVFDFGSAPFVRLREEIWLTVFEQACQSQVTGLIFTFNPERTVNPDFVQKAVGVIGREGGQVDFVELICPIEELKRRIESPSRVQYRKLGSVPLFEGLQASGEFDTSHMPPARLSIDTSRLGPVEAVTQIRRALEIA